MQQVIAKYQNVFAEPVGLPPFRSRNHHIELIHGSTPPNLHPYRYPFYQKSEIEKLVFEMLQSGVIRNTNSPPSSPVLLVRKSYESWGMCVDCFEQEYHEGQISYPKH